MTRRLLIVDDGALSRDLLIQVFEDSFEIEVAHDGGSAVVLAAATEFDAVLMDVALPGLSGLDAVRSIRAGGSDVPIVAVTARVMPGDRERALAAGCDAFVAKPIDDDMLVDTVRCLVEGR